MKSNPLIRYIVPLLLYVLVPFLLDKTNMFLNLLIQIIIFGGVLVYFFKQYTEIKYKFDWLAIFTGIIIFLLWIGIEQVYPQSKGPGFNPYEFSLALPLIVLRLIKSVAIAPLIEELFTRSFLMRFVILLADKKKSLNAWVKIPVGKYTLFSFIVTVLFFGFSHTMWIAGLVTGVILNLLLYKQKSIWSCILAHGVANLALSAYILTTGAWIFW